MKFFIACLIALGACVAAEVEFPGDDVQPIAPVGECPPVDGEFPVLLPDSTNRTIFYICSNGRPIMTRCANGTEFDVELQTCTAVRTFSPVGECPAVDGELVTLLPDSENNTIYYECVRGTPILMFCPPGLVFNANLSVCDWPVRTLEPSGECPDEVGTVSLLADKVSCSTYYVCFAGKPFMATCPEGLVFNPDMKYCDFPSNVKCPGGEQEDEEEKHEDEDL